MAYISILHYIQALAKVRPGDTEAVKRAVRDLLFIAGMLFNPHILANGRVVMDHHMDEVKKLDESKSAADLDYIRENTTADRLFTPRDRS